MEITKYTCKKCGQEHEEWPAIGYMAPDSYEFLSQEEKETIADLSDDFCVITYPDGRIVRLIRAVYRQKVNDSCQDLDYGVWVSLSENSFNDYDENYLNPDHEAVYFGWLDTDIPGYEFEDSIPCNVECQGARSRPLIYPHQTKDHPLVHDFYNGISLEEAEERVRKVMTN